MFSPNLDLVINQANPTASGRLSVAGSRVVEGPPRHRRLIRNDAGIARVRVCEPCFTGERAFDDVDISAAQVVMALGSVDRVPSTGTFPLAPTTAQTSGTLTVGKRYYISTFVSGDVFTNVGAASNATGVTFTATGTTPTTWTNGSSLKEITTAIAVDAEAEDVEDALNATAAIIAAGGVTVSSPAPGKFEVTFVSLGNQPAISCPVTTDMFPLSIVSVSTVQTGSAALHEIQFIRLIENPYCYAALGTVFASAAAAVTTIQTQTASLSAIKKLTLNPIPYGGTCLITLDGTTFEAPWDATSSQMQALAGANYTVVRRATNAWEFTRITVNTAMSLSANVTNLLVPVGVSGTMPLNTLGMFQAFTATDADTLLLTLEVNITFPGFATQKIFQEVIEVHRDLIDVNNLVTPGLGGVILAIGQSDDLSVSSAGTSDLVPGVDFSQWFQLVNVGAGAGAYTHNLTIDNANAVEGSIFRIELDIEASANPAIAIYDESTGGALLQAINGQLDAATYFLFEARYTGTNWVKFGGSYQI